MRIFKIVVFSIWSSVAMSSASFVAQAQPVRENAINNPHRHAWDLFLALNHPAIDPKVSRGAPDLTKKIGDTGITVWETWKHAGREVFLPDGSKPAPWEQFPDDAVEAKAFDVTKPVLLRALSEGMAVDDLRAFNQSQFKAFLSDPGHLDPGEGQFDPANFSGGGETRMNKATFDFIISDENQLYNIDGQESFLQDVIAGRRQVMSFPLDSIEVKAMWLPLTDEDVSSGRDKRYHVGRDKDGKQYGLVALHIITKDIPNWFWASFHHIDGKVGLIPPQDTVGRPDALKGTKWEYYALTGTQTDFVDSTGRATLLSDPHIENGFERSSCITCHAQATIGVRQPGSSGANRLPVFQIQRTNPDFLRQPSGFGLPSNHAGIGIPFPDQYFDARGSIRYIQLDFLYSLHIRASRKTAQ
jgi:hypothetical protein